MGRTLQLSPVEVSHRPSQPSRFDIRLAGREEKQAGLAPHTLFLSHPEDDEVHKLPRRMTTTLRRRHPSPRRSADPDGIPSPQSATDAYGRPVDAVAQDHPYRFPHRTSSLRDASPRRGQQDRGRGGYLGRSRAASIVAYGDDAVDDEHIEVIEEVEVDGKAARYAGRLRQNRDHDADSWQDKKHHRRRRRPQSEEPDNLGQHYAASEYQDSTPYASLRTLGRSESSRGKRRGGTPDVIEESRPPVSSKRPSWAHKRHRSADIIQVEEPGPRRSSSVKTARDRAASLSGGPVGILGSLLRGRQNSVKDARASRKPVECVICMGAMSPSKTAKLKCGHSMCRACLERSFKLSTTDPQHMPPQCCNEDIPVEHVARLFPLSFKKMWNRKFAEFSTKNRVYCPSRRCGEWIKPANIRREGGREVARCSRCRTKVCCSCNGRWHVGGPCPIDPETAKILAQAQEEGWKRCYKCQNLVELKEGCNHMTCRCGAEFCMLCGIKWRNCDCPWFNDDEQRGHFLDDMDIPVPHIRGGLDDIFRGDGPPAPPELRGQTGLSQAKMAPVPVPVSLPVHRRPRTYQEEMHERRMQESHDADVARRLMYEDDFYDKHDHRMGETGGEMHNFGNPAGHYMNEEYGRARGVGHYRRPSPSEMYDAADDFEAHHSPRRAQRVEASREHPAGGRYQMRSPPAARAAAYPVGLTGAPPTPPTPPTPTPPPPPQPAVPSAPKSPRRPLRHPSLGGEMYSPPPYTSRSERAAGDYGARPPRHHHHEDDGHDDAETHPPARGRHGWRMDWARSSDLAGLNGREMGMNRVDQWRTFIEPGVPEGESVAGHM